VTARVFVVVPAFNEASVIGSTLEQLMKLNHAIVTVDDGSTDDTWSVLSHLPVYALRHPFNLGQGAALQTGMTFALQRNAEIIVHFDADGQHQAADMETLIEPIRRNQADLVFGSRFLRNADSLAVPFLRRRVLKAARIVNGFSTGLWLSDAHNGFRALSATAARKIELSENGFAHASEIMNRAHKLKLRIAERPTAISYTDYSRARGQSSWNAVNIMMDLSLRRILK
jgi:glycosyltransferase involved in cell wall biosynthesis